VSTITQKQQTDQPAKVKTLAPKVEVIKLVRNPLGTIVYETVSRESVWERWRESWNEDDELQEYEKLMNG